MRMEDIDPPREVKGASDHILKQLEAHGLLWDDEVLYQSNRLDNYAEIVDDLKKQDFAYNCECSRKRVTELNGIYDGYCRPLNLSIQGNGTRLHLKPSQQPIEFTAQIIGHYSQQSDVVVVSLCMAGALAGFLIFNNFIQKLNQGNTIFSWHFLNKVM